MDKNNMESFFGAIDKTDSICEEIVEIIEERLGIETFDEVLGNLPDTTELIHLDWEGRTLDTKELEYLYNDKFLNTESSIVAITYYCPKMLLFLLVKNKEIYYLIPIRQVCFFLNRNKAMFELEKFIKNLG